MNIYSPTISGSLTISGSIITTGGGLPLTGSLVSSGSFTSIGPTVVSGSFTVVTGSAIEFQVLDAGVKIGNLVTDSHSITGSLTISGSITTNSTITAQTLVVQTITSSVSFITGSTRFGSLSSNTHQFTGSVLISGSNVLIGTTTSNGFRFKVSNNGAEEWALNPGDSTNVNNHVNYNRNTSAYIGANYLAATHSFLNGNVGIGTSSPTTLLDVVGSGNYDGVIFVRSTGTNTPKVEFGVDAITNADGYVGTANNWPFYIRTNDANRIAITTSGQVGIGTNSVDSTISVDIQNTSPTSNNVFLRIKNNVGSEDCGIKIAGIFGSAYEHTFGVNTIMASGDLIFHNSNTLGYRWFIDGSQRLSITSGGFTKQSNGDYSYLANASHETTSTTNSNYIDIITHRNSNPYGIFIDYPNASPNNSGNEFIACEDSTNAKFYVYANGNVVNRNGTYGTISSDLRLKENIIEASSKLNDILNLRVVNFNLKEDIDKKKQIGFIAQEFKEVFPSLVYEKDTRKYDEDGNLISGFKDSLGVQVGMEFAILVKAIQELKSQNDALQTRIETLEQK
jgi:hypothetical protein